MFSRHNHFYLVRNVWGCLRHAEWDDAWNQAGPFGLLREFLRALFALNSWPFFVPVSSGWQAKTLRVLLRQYGIPAWGWGVYQQEVCFQVRLRQAHWAQYLLLQNGAPLTGQLLDEAGHAAHRPAPKRRSAHPSPGGYAPMPPAQSPAADAPAPHLFRDPVGAIDQAVNRIARW